MVPPNKKVMRQNSSMVKGQIRWPKGTTNQYVTTKVDKCGLKKHLHGRNLYKKRPSTDYATKQNKMQCIYNSGEI